MPHIGLRRYHWSIGGAVSWRCPPTLTGLICAIDDEGEEANLPLPLPAAPTVVHCRVPALSSRTRRWRGDNPPLTRLPQRAPAPHSSNSFCCLPAGPLNPGSTAHRHDSWAYCRGTRYPRLPPNQAWRSLRPGSGAQSPVAPPRSRAPPPAPGPRGCLGAVRSPSALLPAAGAHRACPPLNG
ncbi:hypothetical protein NDU88_001667 [Pleurodeles waltl]|uniref:Uncharacterized protein n=1 Tax=Pleurodeles waltl TaxID=8319 RepID=A0AAV7RD98_PLEWA|nr:hypothetical protein NDU88_001667 [Pleurodeles waltl]